MIDKKIENLIENLRTSASYCGKIPPADRHKELMEEAAEMLEQMAENYQKDIVLGGYVSRDAVMRQFAKWCLRSHDGRGDLNSLSAMLFAHLPISKDEAVKLMKANGGREFTVATPKGWLKAHAKYATDAPEDYPGVYIDIIQPDGDDLLCCVEYDSLADGIYCRVYAEGDAPSDSIRFESLDKEEKECAV